MAVLLIFFVIGSLGINFTISGFSSGGFFAHQLHIAYSASITGAGIVAGGPYYCSLGSALRSGTSCMINPYFLDVTVLTQFAKDSASSNLIDDVRNIANDKVYIFSGTKDTRVLQSAVKVTEQVYRYFINNNYQIQTVYNISAQHAWVTNTYGKPCWVYSSPGINNCGYDMAEAMLTQILKTLIPKGAQIPSNLLSFNQANYTDVWKAGLSSRGWIYLPRYCVNNKCSVHLAFHGCHQYYDLIGDPFIKETGLNEWAETNDIIIIYPQTIANDANPEGCWDFYGYTGPNFAYQSGIQMKAVYAMAQNPPYVTWI